MFNACLIGVLFAPKHSNLQSEKSLLSVTQNQNDSKPNQKPSPTLDKVALFLKKFNIKDNGL